MAQVTVRDIEAKVIAELRRRAKRHGRSIGEEIREVLRDAVKGEAAAGRGLGTRIASLFRDVGLSLHFRFESDELGL